MIVVYGSIFSFEFIYKVVLFILMLVIIFCGLFLVEVYVCWGLGFFCDVFEIYFL